MGCPVGTDFAILIETVTAHNYAISSGLMPLASFVDLAAPQPMRTIRTELLGISAISVHIVFNRFISFVSGVGVRTAVYPFRPGAVRDTGHLHVEVSGGVIGNRAVKKASFRS